MDRLDDFVGLELQTSFLIYFLTPLVVVALDIIRNGTSLHQDVSFFLFFFFRFYYLFKSPHHNLNRQGDSYQIQNI